MKKKVTTGGKVNFIPEAAIHESEVARDPRHKVPKLRIFPRKESDPYSEDRMSKTEPTAEQVRNAPPDDTVNPG